MLPVLPLKNTVLFPYLLSRLLVELAALQAADRGGAVALRQRLLVCVAVRNAVDGRPGPVYRVGTLMRVAKMVKFPDDTPTGCSCRASRGWRSRSYR